MKMNTDRNWLLTKAEQEDGCMVSVGGLVTALEGKTPAPDNVIPLKVAFSRFLLLARRERKLSLERFAEATDVDLAELLKIEADEHYVPSPRTVHQVAGFLKVPAKKLMTLAGLLQAKDVQFQNESLRFAYEEAKTMVREFESWARRNPEEAEGLTIHISRRV